MRRVGYQVWAFLGVAMALAIAPGDARGQQRTAVEATVEGAEEGALRHLLDELALRNALPPMLAGYSARVETEITVLLRREDGTETVTSTEQVASAVEWVRGGAFTQRVIGYRSLQSVVGLSTLTMLRSGWLPPFLYGDALSAPLAMPSDVLDQSAAAGGARAPHRHSPLAGDRAKYFRFAGGDTAARLRVGARDVSILRVFVEPRDEVDARGSRFRGEIDFDAEKGVLVRARGAFDRPPRNGRWALGLAGDVAAFVEFENAERLGRYWLPSRQRVELQASVPALSQGRAVIRIVSRFIDLEVREALEAPESWSGASAPGAPARGELRVDPADVVKRHRGWQAPLGSLTEGMHADDFRDVAPERWRSTGAPRLDIAATRASDILHFNRVDGAFTGLGLRLALRDAAPGTTLQADAGWSWSARAFRGRLRVERAVTPWTVAVRAGQWLDITNDFRPPFDHGSSLNALLRSRDDYDYVVRRGAGAELAKTFASKAAAASVEFGVMEDRYLPTAIARGWSGERGFLPNRGLDEGRYTLAGASVEWHPELSAEYLKSGVGARLSLESANGALEWRRVEGRAVYRGFVGPLLAVTRVDAGIVVGARIPAQQLFELGGDRSLPGYEYKEYAGSRAVLVRSALRYTSPVLSQPLVVGKMVLPALAPGLSVSLQSGWADAPNGAARAAITRLTTSVRIPPGAPTLAPGPTEGVRTSITAGVHVFSGALLVGVSRALPGTHRWQPTITVGRQW